MKAPRYSAEAPMLHGNGSTRTYPAIPSAKLVKRDGPLPEHLERQCAELKIGDEAAGGALVRDDAGGRDPLPEDLVDSILGRLPVLKVLQLRSKLGKTYQHVIHRPGFRFARPDTEGEYSPSFFVTDSAGHLQWHGFDTARRCWARLPSLDFAPALLPAPDPELFKGYLVASDGGLLCLDVGRPGEGGRLVICNPLTREAVELPQLIHRRHPVLMHLIVDRDSAHYNVIVAGSAAIGTDAVALKTEVYDSRSGKWNCPPGSDLPCPAFALNEYQTGAYYHDAHRALLMCVALGQNGGRGVLVYDIQSQTWAPELLPIPVVGPDAAAVHLATTQVVACGGSVFVFSEQECGRDVFHVVHRLVPVPNSRARFDIDEVARRKSTAGRGLLVYPERTCVPLSDHELCFYNTLEHTLEVLDVSHPTDATYLQISTPSDRSPRFYTLNPLVFAFQPSFKRVVSPPTLPRMLTDSDPEPDSDLAPAAPENNVDRALVVAPTDSRRFCSQQGAPRPGFKQLPYSRAGTSRG